MKTSKNKITYKEQINHYSKIIKQNFALFEFYKNNYELFVKKLNKLGISNPKVVELGSGPSFLKEFYKDTIYTDIENHENCDLVVDAQVMPFENNSIDAFFLQNVFHHIPDISNFLTEADRCLKKNGIIYIIDPHNSIFSHFIYKYFHHEQFDLKGNWKFLSNDPQSDSNQAMSWIVFERDLSTFNKKFPNFKIIHKSYFSFLNYLISGGINYNFKIPKLTLTIINFFEKLLKNFMKRYLGLYCCIIIKKL